MIQEVKQIFWWRREGQVYVPWSSFCLKWLAQRLAVQKDSNCIFADADADDDEVLVRRLRCEATEC